MANEFYYCATLSIVHPTIDPQLITQTISSLRPRIESMAGSERRLTDGTPVVPPRRVLLSHWLADLHEEDKLFSSDAPLSDFIERKIRGLTHYQDFLLQLQQEGQVAIVVDWFSETGHSSGVLNASVLRKCGEMGIDIELNFYNP